MTSRLRRPDPSIHQTAAHLRVGGGLSFPEGHIVTILATALTDLGPLHEAAVGFLAKGSAT